MGQVAGIRVENGHVTVRPITDRRLGFVEASYDSPLGTVAVAWRYEGEALHVQVTIPPNATATVELPNGSHEVTTGCYRYEIDCK